MCIPTILKLKMFAAFFSTACLRTPTAHVMNSETVYTAKSYIYTIASSEVIPVHTNRRENAYHMNVKYAGLVHANVNRKLKVGCFFVEKLQRKNCWHKQQGLLCLLSMLN